MTRLIRAVAIAFLVMLAVVFSLQFLKSVIYVVKFFSHYYWFIAGGIMYYILMCTVWKNNLAFFQTWTHEFLHTLMCVLFFHRIDSFHATSSEGGFIQHRGRQNIVISLAPYTFPFFTIVLLLLRLVVPLKYVWFTLLIGFTFFMHLHAFIAQIRPYQIDLTNHGLLMSYAYIFAFLPMNLGICLYAVDMNIWYGLKFFLDESWSMASMTVLKIIA